MGSELRYRPSGPHWTAGELLLARERLNRLTESGWHRWPGDVLTDLWADWWADAQATFGADVRLDYLHHDTRRAAP